jgi:hypothetical protein
LLTTKVLPPLTAGSAPDYGETLPDRPERRRTVCWDIRWNDRTVGWASNEVVRHVDGTGEALSTVQFENLSLDQMIHEVFGDLGALMRPLVADVSGVRLDLRVVTSLAFDHHGALHHFDTKVDVGSLRQVLQIDGKVRGNRLRLTAYAIDTPGSADELYRKEIDLPPGGLIMDSISPRPKLERLRVGQSWTFQSYRPFMPYNPLQIIQATVERTEVIDWNGQLVKTFLVTYRQDAGSGITATRQPVCQLWVRQDGAVLRQLLGFASLRVQFNRTADDACDPMSGAGSAVVERFESLSIFKASR